MAVTFDTLTIPVPEPYDDKDPQRQFENLCFVLLQVLQLMKEQDFEISTNVFVPEMSIDLTGVETAIKDLQYEGILLDLGHIKVIRTGKTGSAINI